MWKIIFIPVVLFVAYVLYMVCFVIKNLDEFRPDDVWDDLEDDRLQIDTKWRKATAEEHEKIMEVFFKNSKIVSLESYENNND